MSLRDVILVYEEQRHLVAERKKDLKVYQNYTDLTLLRPSSSKCFIIVVHMSILDFVVFVYD